MKRTVLFLVTVLTCIGYGNCETNNVEIISLNETYVNGIPKSTDIGGVEVELKVTESIYSRYDDIYIMKYVNYNPFPVTVYYEYDKVVNYRDTVHVKSTLVLKGAITSEVEKEVKIYATRINNLDFVVRPVGIQ